MFGRKKETPVSPQRTREEESRQRMEDFREELGLTTATSLVADGLYESLEDAVMKTIKDLWSYDSKYRIYASDEEAAAYDDGSELARARAKLDGAHSLSDEEANRLVQKEYDEEEARRQESIANARECIARLGAVLEQAHRWTPPDELSASFKQKFVERVTRSVSNRNREIERLGSESIARPSASEYRDRLIATWSHRVASLEAGPSSEARHRADAAKREAWKQSLRQSFASSQQPE